MTKFWNILYAVVCSLAALGSETGTLPFPDKWKHYVAAAALIAMWLKSHWNLFQNPDGTPAHTAYAPPEKKQ